MFFGKENKGERDLRAVEICRAREVIYFGNSVQVLPLEHDEGLRNCSVVKGMLHRHKVQVPGRANCNKRISDWGKVLAWFLQDHLSTMADSI